MRFANERQAAAYAVEQGCDCVIAHTPPFFSVARYLGHRPLFYIVDHGEPPAALFEDSELRETLDWEKRFSAPLAHRVFVISQAIFDEQYRPDARILRNGNTHLAAWSPEWAARRRHLRRKFGFEGQFVVLNVCRFHEEERRYKGLDLYLTLAAEASYAVPGLSGRATFAIAGRGDDDDVAFLRSAGLTIFQDITDAEMAELYAASDLYVSLSQWEGYNLGIGQALAMGLGVIASDIPAHREFGIPTANAMPRLCALLGEALSRWSEDPADRTARIETWDVPLSQLVDTLEADLDADADGPWL
jgi:glycosyltransferase involved in cell wall biosynthesis